MQLIFILLLGVIGSLLSARSQPKYETRAVWLTTLGGMDWPRNKATNADGIRRQQQELCDVLDCLQAARFNTVLLQTRLRGDLIYPSALEPFAESLTGQEGRDPGYDPLAFAIEECHKRGMELHAWLVTIPVGNVRQVKLQGNRSVARQNRDLCKLHNGNWYLDPGNPGTQEYLSRIVREITTRYDIDGIHFDYIRYPEQAEKFPDGDTYRRYGQGKDLAQWRRDNMTNLVRRLYAEIKALKPWVKVSSSPVGKFRDTNRYSSRGWNAYYTVFQDAQEWLKEGIHDMLFPMLYFRGNNFYPFALDWKENDSGRRIVPGLGIYFLSPAEQDWPLEEIVRQIHFCRRFGLDGQAYFRTRFLLDNTKGILDELKENIYTTPALVPPLTGTDSLAPSVPTHPVLQPLPNGHLRMGWQASTDESGCPVVYRLYAADRYPVDTNDPNNLVETRLTSPEYEYAPTLPWQWKRYFTVTAADRFGNESMPLELNTPTDMDLPLLNHGDLLSLPVAEEQGQKISLCNVLGDEILHLDYTPQVSLASLPTGFYLLYIIRPTGESTLAGTVIK